ncbi:cation-translocating P-type ATPase [Streptoalloteichus hindustanus]|uniref:Cation-transporting ATPase F n=1 Tax=Streptoalloteichus hindustanus TaxID=2017 RepID=A0A1M5DSL7_STRHI|nr:HAD-IC family P-type ATPase [Streptoalloteichus hindustanus]SHF69864.1 cation-transporting ATPase F [Streptoalloteichus hindustanus]
MWQRTTPATGPAETAPPPHHLTPPELARQLATSPEAGLTEAEAARRRERLGPNALTASDHDGPLRRLGQQFTSPLILVLLASAAITGALGQLVDAAVVLGVVLLNAVIGFLQESRAQRALDALARMARTEAKVLRDGVARRVAAEDLVPGDLVLLDAGDRIPADVRWTRVSAAEVDESALTGESAPVGKDVAPLPVATELPDRTNMGYSGTVVTRGGGRAVVVATGASTELGRIHRLVARASPTQTPLTRKLVGFSRQLTAVIVALAALAVAVGVWRGSPWGEMVTAAVALAVGAIPEGLPAAVTIVLAIGVVRMARRNAVVRHLPAVETLGSTTVICTDKTGTLTTGAMTVTGVLAGGRRYDVDGSGYEPRGEVRTGGRVVSADGEPALRECLLAGVLCNDARLQSTVDGWRHVGDPTEVALLAAAVKAGLDLAAVRSSAPRADVLPFESDRRYMATVHSGRNGLAAGYVKGAVERVLARCDDELGPDGAVGVLDRARVRADADRLAERGLRVLALARFDVPPGFGALTEDTLPRLTLVGLQAMHDPPRPAAGAAVSACRDAGVEVKMITGDHPGTARAVAAELGLHPRSDAEASPVLTGAHLARCADDELAEAVEATTVFARVSPEQKLRLVESLQRRGHVVAMTGDGVNDAPALRRADIGIAMGRDGTEAAKDAADMVLTDDDFATIEAAVEEGRGVFDNLRKFIAWTLPTNIGEGLVILVAVLLGATLPILPAQILWINMTTAVLLGLTLAFEPKEPHVMRRPPRDPDQPLLTADLVRRVLLVSLVLVAGSFAAVEWELAAGADLATARTVAVNVFVAVQVAYLLNCRSLERFAPIRRRGRNPWIAAGVVAMAGLQLLMTYTPAMNHVFHTAPLGAGAWARVLGVAALAFVVVEVDKLVWRGRDLRAGRRTPPAVRTPAARRGDGAPGQVIRAAGVSHPGRAPDGDPHREEAVSPWLPVSPSGRVDLRWRTRSPRRPGVLSRPDRHSEPAERRTFRSLSLVRRRRPKGNPRCSGQTPIGGTDASTHRRLGDDA